MTDLFQRPSFYDQVALDAAREIKDLSNEMNETQKTARIQLIVLKAMCCTAAVTNVDRGSAA